MSSFRDAAGKAVGFGLLALSVLEYRQASECAIDAIEQLDWPAAEAAFHRMAVVADFVPLEPWPQTP